MNQQKLKNKIEKFKQKIEKQKLKQELLEVKQQLKILKIVNRKGIIIKDYKPKTEEPKQNILKQFVENFKQMKNHPFTPQAQNKLIPILWGISFYSLSKDAQFKPENLMPSELVVNVKKENEKTY